MENEIHSVKIAVLEERIAGTAKALELAQGSIAQAASLDKRVAVIETRLGSESGEKKGSSNVWQVIVTILSLIIAAVAVLKK